MSWPIDYAGAVPACPEGVEVAQPDGTQFKLHVRGDEFFAWHETEDGYAVVKDAADGFWKFAQPATDRAAFRAIQEARVGSADPARYAVRKHALPNAKALRTQLSERQHARRGTPQELPVPNATYSLSQTVASDDAAQEPSILGIPVSGTKTIKNIVILACFSDHWDSGSGTVLATQGRVAVNEYSNLFNQVNYTTDSAVGSVRDYYAAMSYGKLTVQSVVTPWVQLPKNEAYYGGNGAGSTDTNVQQMVSDAIAAAATAGFNFSSGDSDGDGWIDCLTIIHSGHGEEYSGNPSTCIWSYQWNLASVVTKNSVKMYRYHTEPALRGWMPDSTYGIIRIGVICHEMGHFFGLPDLYDYSRATEGLGNWSIMAGGSWNGSYGASPAHFDAWSKCFLGFVNPVSVHSQAGMSLARAEDNSVVKLLRDGTANGEYFLLENRAKTGFDNASQIYPGLLIYHVYSQSANNDLGTWTHPVVKIEEADGDDSLGSNVSSSEAGDVWTSTSGLSGGFRDQTGSQSANAMLYQSVAYNRTNSAASYSYNTVSNFSAAGSVMTCNLMSLKTTVGSQAVSTPAYTVSWPACSQTTKYEIQEGVKTNQSSFADGAEDEDAMCENWYLAGTVKRDSAGKRSGSYSYSMHQNFGGKWGSSVQTLTLRKTFKVGAGTVISFYLMSHLSLGYGYLKCQISNDSGDTWKTLETYGGYIDPWSSRSYNYAALNAQGISTGNLCTLRFVADFEYCSGWSAFPGYGFAVDDISITGTEMASYSGWSALSSNVVSTAYGVSNKTSAVYAYRVRAYANGVWQGYGSEGEVAVDVPVLTLAPVTQEAGSFGGSYSIGVTADRAWAASETSSWIALTGGTSGTGTGTVYYSVATNTLANSRGANITVACGGITQACAVVQAGGSTSTTPVPVPFAWLDTYGLVSGGNYESAAAADADGDGQLSWQEYVSGSLPTNRNSTFRAYIGITNGRPRVTWSPNLGTSRVYTVDGKSALTNAAWVSPTNAASRFFRVKVSLE